MTDLLSPLPGCASPAVGGHLDALMARRPELLPCRSAIEAAFEQFLACYRAGGTVLFCGNGGSAADSDHWAGELLKGFEKKRPVAQDLGLPPDLAGRIQQGLRAIPLTGFPALRTAVANDCDPQLEFAQLVLSFGRPGDLFVGISTSGNAKNVGHAARVAKALGLRTLALTGEGGGALAGLCDVAIRVPSSRTCFVQELHLPIYHTLCLMIEDAFYER